MSRSALLRQDVQEHSDISELQRDALAFFNQNRSGSVHGSGNMGKWTYSSQTHKDDPVCGGILWDLFVVLHRDYYVKRNQIRLINENLDWLQSVTGDVDAVLDFGCGGDEAIQDQAIPLLQKYNTARSYMPIDLCGSFIDAAVSQITTTLNGSVRIIPCEADFTKPLHGVPAGRKLGLFFGASTNFEEFPEGMTSLLDAFKDAVGQGGFLAMAIDTNNDAASVRKSYDHPLHGQQILNIVHRLKRDLNIQGTLDPRAWEYDIEIEEVEYSGHKVLLAKHDIVATRDQSFVIDRHFISIKAGERLTVDKSYKIPVPLMDILAEQKGYTSVGCVYDSQKRMALPVYQVSPRTP